MFKKFKQQCRIAKRHGKTIITFESFVNLATAAYRHSSLSPQQLMAEASCQHEPARLSAAKFQKIFLPSACSGGFLIYIKFDSK
jgi:hypothetical protein